METIKLAAIAIMSITFVTYTTYITLKFGILKSISESYYHLEGKKKILFSLFTWGISLPMMVFCFDYTFVWPLFVSIVLMCFVGVFTMFKKKPDTYIHVACATGSIIFAFIGLLYHGIAMLIPAILMIILGIIILRYAKKYTWYIELLSFIIIIISLTYTIY